MNILAAARCAAFTVALFSLAACAGGFSRDAQTPNLVGIPPWKFSTIERPSLRTVELRNAAAGGARLFVSDVSANVVDIFAQKTRKKKGSIADGIVGPDGSFDDGSSLYVTNTGTSTILVYPNGAVKPAGTYSNGIADAVDVIVGTDGTVYAANYNLGGAGSIVEYPKGSTDPSLDIPLGQGVLGLALDAGGNLYACANRTSGGDGAIYEFAPGSSVGKNLNISLGFCGGIRFDKSGNLVVADQNNDVIDIFGPGKIIPKRRITMDLVSPYHLAFDRARSNLYVADYGSKSVHVFDYASGTVEADITGFQSPLGVATVPEPPF